MSIEIPSNVIDRAIASFWHELDPEERQDPEWREWAEEKVLAMLHAALEGWMVPESVQLQDPGGCWWSFNTPSALADAKSLGWPARTLYTLRKDKTP